MKALIKNNIIAQISEKEFLVHPDYRWVDCPDNCDTLWTFENDLFIPPVPVIEPEDNNFINLKKLDALWKFCDTGDRADIDKIKSQGV